MEGRVMYVINAIWDPDASVWVATSEHVPGLVAEAGTLEELLNELAILLPELLDVDQVLSSSDMSAIPVQIMAERLEQITLR